MVMAEVANRSALAAAKPQALPPPVANGGAPFHSRARRVLKMRAGRWFRYGALCVSGAAVIMSSSLLGIDDHALVAATLSIVAVITALVGDRLLWQERRLQRLVSTVEQLKKKIDRLRNAPERGPR